MGRLAVPRAPGILAVLATALLVTIIAAPAPVLADPGCTTANVLSGSNFEIDVNANLRVDGASPCIDWLAGGTGSALRAGVLAKNDKPSGSGDDSFGQGTSEDDANPTIVTGSIPPNKSDLKVFGVNSESGTSTADNPTGKFLELFWSRVQNPSGTTNMDFELNQKFCSGSSSDTNCADNGTGTTPETPVRTVGDKLISYDLSQGGTVPTISIRTWGGSSWGFPTVITGGVQPRAIGSVNTSTIDSADAGGLGSLDPFTFGEAAISYSALFSGSACGTFGSAYLKSRASDSFSTEVKDFVAPERVRISSCVTSISTRLSASTITVGQSVTDSATLSGATGDAGGTVTYSVFNNNTCTGTPVASGGTKTVTNGVVPDSNSVTFNSAGTFYWQASYSGDASNESAKSACTSEQLIVKAKPSISTLLSASTIMLGQSVTDSATLTGATSNAGGTVTYSVFNNNTCTGTPVASGGTKTVTNGVVPNSNSVTFNSAGLFYWQASYSGDANNLSAKSTCTSEQLFVRKAVTSISTTLSANPITVGQSVHDSATLTGATSSAGGTVTYTVYSDNQCTQNPIDAGTKTVTNGVVPDSNSVTFNSAGTFYWQASYSGDPNNRPSKSACTSEQLVVKAKPSISTTLSASPIAVGQSIHDSATLTGATSNAGGTVTYSVFANNTCTGTPVASGGTKTVTNGGVPDSDSVTFNSAGTFYWQASYSGDANNVAATSACTSEQLKVYGSCVLGYPSGQPPALSSVVFNESAVLRAFAALPGGGSVAGPNDQIAVWYNDEHALTLGVGRVVVKTSSGTTTTDYPITPLSADPVTHAGGATNPQVGTTLLGSGLFFPNTSGHNPQGFPNDQAGTDIATWNSTYFFLDNGRPMWPALFITDITSDPNDRSGDWQQGGTAAIPPNAVFGTWKGAVRTVDKTRSPYAITVTPGTDPAKNNWNLDGGDPAPAGLANEGYGAEGRWNVSGLGLQAGHAYRLQFMVHDGDQNKSGGDSGEGCMNVVIPG